MPLIHSQTLFPGLRLDLRSSLPNERDKLQHPFGGRTRIRTLDPLIKSQLLYQLSYAPGSRGKPQRDQGALHSAQGGFVQPLLNWLMPHLAEAISIRPWMKP